MQSVEAPEAESSPPRAFFGLSDTFLNSLNTLRLSEEAWLSAVSDAVSLVVMVSLVDVASWDVASWDVASWDVASWDLASWDMASCVDVEGSAPAFSALPACFASIAPSPNLVPS